MVSFITFPDEKLHLFMSSCLFFPLLLPHARCRLFTKEISGRLHSIELNVIAQDYQVIMQILEKNMREGQNEFKKPKKPKSASQQRQEASKGEKFTLFLFFASLSNLS